MKENHRDGVELHCLRLFLCRILPRHISEPVRNSWYNRKIYKQLAHFIFTTSDDTTRHLQQVFKLKDMEIFSMSSGIIEPGNLVPKDAARKALAKELSLDAAMPPGLSDLPALFPKTGGWTLF